MVWIRDDPGRQHGNARALRACIWAVLYKLPLVRTLLPWHSMAVFIGTWGTCLSSFVLSIERLTPPSSAHASAVCDTEAPPADVQTTSPRSCRQRPFALNEVVDYRLALQAICSAVVLPTSPSLPCATSSALSEVSPHSLLETRTIVLDIRLHCAICTDLLQVATCVVRHAELLNVVTRLEVESSKHHALPWIS